MLEKNTEKVRFHSPLKGFEMDEQDIEYRKDELTGKWSRVNIQRSKRVKQGQGDFDYTALLKKAELFFLPREY